MAAALERARIRLMAGGGLLAEYRVVRESCLQLSALAVAAGDTACARTLAEVTAVLDEIEADWASLCAESRAVFDAQLPATVFSQLPVKDRLARLTEILQAAAAGLRRACHVLTAARSLPNHRVDAGVQRTSGRN